MITENFAEKSYLFSFFHFLMLIWQFFGHLHHFPLINDVKEWLTHQDEYACMVCIFVNHQTIVLHLDAMSRLVHQFEKINRR